MSKDTFTIERIKAVVEEIVSRCSIVDSAAMGESIIAELTKPVWTPKPGKWYFFRWNGATDWVPCLCVEGEDFPSEHEYRPLTASEIGLEPFEYKLEDPDKFYTTIGWNKAMRHVNNTLFPDKEKQ